MKAAVRDIAELLRKRAELLAVRERAAIDLESETVAIFSIGGHSFGLPLADVVYAGRLVQLTAIPRGAPHYLGLSWIGGYLVTVLDVATLLGVRDAGLRDVTICMVGSRGGRQIGFGAELLLGIEDVPASQIIPLSSASRREAGAPRLALLGAAHTRLLDLDLLLARLDAGELAGA